MRDEPYPLRPGERVWQGISAARTRKRRHTNQRRRKRGGYAGAAGLIMLIGGLYWYTMGEPNPEIQPEPSRREGMELEVYPKEKQQAALSPWLFAHPDGNAGMHKPPPAIIKPPKALNDGPRQTPGIADERSKGNAKRTKAVSPDTRSTGQNNNDRRTAQTPGQKQKKAACQRQDKKVMLTAAAINDQPLEAAPLRSTTCVNQKLARVAPCSISTSPFDTDTSRFLKKPRWSLGIYYGQGTVKNHWQDLSRRESSPYIASRKATERFRSMQTFKLEIGYRAGQSLYLYTGAVYDQWENKAAKYSAWTRERTKLQVDSIRIQRVTGETWRYDTTVVKVIDSFSHQFSSQNRYQRLHLPLLAGYRHSLDGRFGVEFKGGGLLTLWRRERGLVAHPYQPGKTQKLSSQYEQRTQVQLQAGAGVYYTFYKHCQLHAHVLGRYQLHSTLVPHAEAQQRFSFLTVESGIQYQF